MGKNEKKVSIGFILVTVILIILIIACIFIIFWLKNSISELERKNRELDIVINNSSDEYNELVNTNDELNKELDKFTNIDKTISSEKEEVFKLASQLEKEIIDKKSKSKIAYLTFDDGPYYSTHKYLEILDKYNVKATFFTIGLDKEKCFDNRNKTCSTVYKKIVDNGHTIANHTYSHLIHNGLYSSADSFINQVKKQEKLIKDKTGAVTNIVRFPGGSGTAQAYGIKNNAIKKLKSMNYGWVDWSASNGDGGAVGSKSQALNTFKKSIDEDIEVVLLHDYSTVTLAILPDIITYLEDKGYILLPLFYESIKVNK